MELVQSESQSILVVFRESKYCSGLFRHWLLPQQRIRFQSHSIEVILCRDREVLCVVVFCSIYFLDIAAKFS